MDGRDGCDNNFDRIHGGIRASLWGSQRLLTISNGEKKYFCFQMLLLFSKFTCLLKCGWFNAALQIETFNIYEFQHIWFISVRKNICLFIHLFKVHMFIVLASNLPVAAVCANHTNHCIEPNNWNKLNTVKLTMYGRASCLIFFSSW